MTGRGRPVQRYKGLGEMKAEQLAETIHEPEKRTLLQVRLEEAPPYRAKKSLHVMGEDVESRRSSLKRTAGRKDLDV